MSSLTLSLAHLIVKFEKATGHGPSFVGVTYTSKSSGETARYTFLIGASYLNTLRKSLAELEVLPAVSALEIQAKTEVKASLEKSIAAHEAGTQSEDYTKKGMYSDVVPGIKEFNDGTCEIAGLQIARKVITPGTFKTVKSAPLTILKDGYRKQLTITKYRTLAIDESHLHSVRVGGTEIEVADNTPTVNVIVPVTAPSHKDFVLTVDKTLAKV